MKRLLWIVLLAASPAQATRVAVTSVQCPLDGTAVRVHEKLSGDNRGGWDSDMARYSSDGQWRAYAISTCPSEFLTLLGKDFERIKPDQLGAVEAVLAPWRTKYSAADLIPTWERYEIAADVYRALDWPAGELAQLYLEGSWTARDQVVGIYGGLEGPQGARALLDAGAGELAKNLDAPTRKIVLHNLARVAHRGGFNAERDEMLDRFEAVGSLTPREQQVLTEFRFISTQVEPRLQDLAIAELERTLEDTGLDEETRLRTTYQLADLHRRRGRIGDAIAGYAFVTASSATPDEVRELAAWLGAHLSMD
jgi:hypothetical protein